MWPVCMCAGAALQAVMDFFQILVTSGNSEVDFDRLFQVTVVVGEKPIHFHHLFLYYVVYTHVKSFTMVKNRNCGQVTSHCRKAQPYRADLSLSFIHYILMKLKCASGCSLSAGFIWMKHCKWMASQETLAVFAPVALPNYFFET